MKKFFALCSVLALILVLADAPVARGAPGPTKLSMESAVFYAQLLPASDVAMQDIGLSLLVAEPVVVKDVLAFPQRSGVEVVVVYQKPYESIRLVQVCGFDAQEVVATGTEKVIIILGSSFRVAKEAMKTAYADMLGAVDASRRSLVRRC